METTAPPYRVHETIRMVYCSVTIHSSCIQLYKIAYINNIKKTEQIYRNGYAMDLDYIPEVPHATSCLVTSNPENFYVYASLSRQIPQCHFQISHDRLLPNSYLLTIYDHIPIILNAM
jgi:hypothetical protein